MRSDKGKISEEDQRRVCEYLIKRKDEIIQHIISIALVNIQFLQVLEELLPNFAAQYHEILTVDLSTDIPKILDSCRYIQEIRQAVYYDIVTGVPISLSNPRDIRDIVDRFAEEYYKLSDQEKEELKEAVVAIEL